MQTKITTVHGFTIDLSRIKAIKVNTNTNLGPTNVLTVDLNQKCEYIFNPNEDKYVMHQIDDKVLIPYIDYNRAVEAMNDLTELWQEYLDNI